MLITRRKLIQSVGAMAALSAVSGFPRIAFANLPTDNRFILVILRGAMDGLAAVPPYGDRDYKQMRGSLALNAPDQADGALDLDGFFGFNPGFDSLIPLYKQGQLAVIHAVASPYRERSHFDAQNLLENGTIMPGGTEGWLNRALQVMGADNNAAIAINQQIPLVLQGKLGAISWAPKGRSIDATGDYMTKIASLYKNDAMLSSPFNEAIEAQTIAAESLPTDDLTASGNAKDAGEMAVAARAVGAFLGRENGPRVAVMEAGGWDTHARQGAASGQLYNRLSGLGKGLAVLPQALGASWNKTVVVVVTEFGRTVAENGTGGTDHGTASAMLVMGGSVKGGKVLGQWPGLSSGNLYQNRDLMPTTDMRSVFKTVLYSHLNANRDALETTIFPDSSSAGIMGNLLA